MRLPWLTLLVAAGTTGCDLSTKRAAILSTASGSRILIPGALDLVHAENPAMAFSLMASWPAAVRTALLITAALAGITFGLAIAVRKRMTPDRAISVGLIVGGAAGNLVDRLGDGTVTDFLYLHRGAFHWPVFNVADIAICAGALLLALRPGPRERPTA